MSLLRTGILCAAACGALLAQQGAVGGPVTGYVFDAYSKVLRPIRGIPGAAVFGTPLDLGLPTASAWISPKSDSALTIAVDGAVHLFRLDNGQSSELKPEGLVAPERAVYSPSGSALALVTPGSVRIYAGLPDAPAVTGTVDLPVGPVPAAGGVARGKLPRPGGGPVAVSDDGKYLLYGNGESVELIGVAGDSRRLGSAASGAFLAFAPGSHDAAVIDSQKLSLFQDAAGAATVRTFPGVTGLRGAAFSPDAKRLYLAAASLAALDTASGQSAPIACDCRVTGLARMGSAFRLNDLGSGPLWLLDASAEPRTVFVPAAQ